MLLSHEVCWKFSKKRGISNKLEFDDTVPLWLILKVCLRMIRFGGEQREILTTENWNVLLKQFPICLLSPKQKLKSEIQICHLFFANFCAFLFTYQLLLKNARGTQITLISSILVHILSNGRDGAPYWVSFDETSSTISQEIPGKVWYSWSMSVFSEWSVELFIKVSNLVSAPWRRIVFGQESEI